MGAEAEAHAVAADFPVVRAVVAAFLVAHAEAVAFPAAQAV